MPKRTVKVETITPYNVSGYPVPGSVRFRDELQEAVDLCGSLCDGDPEVQSHFWGEGGNLYYGAVVLCWMEEEEDEDETE
jgi:hypothetical protein